MRASLLSVKELAHALGVSVDCVYRAYREGEIPAFQIRRTIRFDYEIVRDILAGRAQTMPYERNSRSATGGASRRRAQRPRPRLGKTGASIAQTPRRKK
jgi:excisionase family DNA binding protein